ncbi:alpha-E domain-containing protein [Rubinisphaera brasiliensis]|uniref:DUF403 domain-containing protein n=1 Tax=Rubinisphaera brasiliensis (strain ATCC 49424 / DSM 5305 / JCM 21570 / IAM 15109 / NBRC 103401 / IFAM 1448) TaxID=756272 RepID=F0ST84_RUBBR|nr:alpha-E domain-containing protein [Rubinisphaera brasiliensis]ADY59295.1 protein of unknown function DUF403 [Rubinisphaera brasiliensis DSM 5305]
MLSRVADAVFWMSRYIERAENVARFIDVNQNLNLGFYQGYELQWEPLVQATGDTERFHELYGESTSRNVVQFLLFDKRNPNSILSCLCLARENARRVRDSLSLAIWEAINKFYLRFLSYRTDSTIVDNPCELLDFVREQSQLVVGATETTLSHSDAWNVSRLGRMIERADKTSRILDVKYFILLPSLEDVGGQLDVVQWTALLNSTSGLQMYRRKYGRIDPQSIVEFLVLDRDFPRSMHFCLNRADEALRSISGSPATLFTNPAELHLGRMKSRMDYLTLQDVFESGLHQFVDDFQTQLNQLGEEISSVFEGQSNGVQRQFQYMSV